MSRGSLLPVVLAALVVACVADESEDTDDDDSAESGDESDDDDATSPVGPTWPEPWLRLVGDAPGDRAGTSVGAAGDVDGDGLPDLLVGAWLSDQGGDDAGVVYLLLGAGLEAGERSLGTANTHLVSTVPGANAGWSVGAAGDVDGDGLDDVLVGAPATHQGGDGPGRAWLVSGVAVVDGGTVELPADALAEIGGGPPGDKLGNSVAGIGDVDGDGVPDVIVGAPGSGSGRVVVFSGSVLAGGGTFSLADALAVFEGEAVGDEAGARVAPAGDVDGDGTPDVAVSALLADAGGVDSGVSWLIAGSRLAAGGTLGPDDALAILSGEGAGHESGWSLGPAGDVDGDGRPDVFVGARLAGGSGDLVGPGRLYVVSADTLAAGGPCPLGGADAVVEGEAVEDYLGWSAASAGDLDGDGHAELWTGAYWHDGGAVDSGRIYLLDGAASSGLVAAADATLGVFDGPGEGDRLGYSMAPAGDVDGDGRTDLLVGAPTSGAGGEDSGEAWLLLAPRPDEAGP